MNSAAVRCRREVSFVRTAEHRSGMRRRVKEQNGAGVHLRPDGGKNRRFEAALRRRREAPCSAGHPGRHREAAHCAGRPGRHREAARSAGHPECHREARHSAGHPECRREMNFTHARRILHGCGRLRVAGKIRKETGSSHGRGSRWKMKGAA